ncbi:MAG: hypothetical protein R3E21_00675 [Caenibius sp.]|nr:hypothetical protein [Novosphingobium sp.]
MAAANHCATQAVLERLTEGTAAPGVHPSTQVARRIDAVAFRHERIAYLPIDEIKPYPGNARTHDEHQITVLMASAPRIETLLPEHLNEMAGAIEHAIRRFHELRSEW